MVNPRERDRVMTRTRTIHGESGNLRTVNMLQVIEKYGGPGGSPTRDLRVRSATLYASELPALRASIVPQGAPKTAQLRTCSVGGDIRTLDELRRNRHARVRLRS
jgi:hypothetical protein